MTPLISARRAAEEFARVVDGTKADEADRFAELTSTVDMLRTHEVPAARADFVADLRTRLMDAADTVLVAAPVRPRADVAHLSPTRRHNRRLAVAAAAFVVVGGTAGVAAASENALPGDPLYPVKRGIESAQISLSSSDATKGHYLISQASTRLDEIDGLINEGGSMSRITHTLGSFQRSATDGSDLLFTTYQRDGDAEDLAALRSTFGEQRATLSELAKQAPPTAQPEFAAAAALIGDLDQQARVLCGNCGPDAGALDFTNLSSAPAMESLMSDPADAAAAARQRSITKALAEQAGEIAANTPKPSSGSTGDQTVGGSLPGVEVPRPSGGSSPVTGTVTTVTDGVGDVLGGVNTSTGGSLAPVTGTVDDTLDTLTGLLLGDN